MKKLQIPNSTVKIILVGVLILLFLIPVSLIKNLIHDRRIYQKEAIQSITEPLGGETEIQGMVIAVPYKVYKTSYDSNKNKIIETEIKYVIFAPSAYQLDIDVNPYYLTRGIFKVPVFTGSINLNAEFSKFDYSYFDIDEKDVLKNDALLILGLSNTKNLTGEPEINLKNKSLSISPVRYDKISPFKTSVFYNLSGLDFAQNLELSGSIGFQGGENIKLYPIASNNAFSMKSAWKAPGFSGGWLPVKRDISDEGFTASWNIAGLSTVYPKSWLSESKFISESVDVSFIVPVDAYKKTERSIKYALLFLVIPFIALLISEVFSKKRIHPVQYCLIGFADIIFYLLLLSVSEHLSFDLTYFICALSVSLATLFYASAIFRNFKWGSLVTGVQLVSYIFLYGTLQAEDYALLIGSIGLFVVVVLLMIITRKIDWYSLNQTEELPPQN